MAMLKHIVKYDIPAFQTILRINTRVIVGSGFQHAHEDSSLVCCQVFWLVTKVGAAGCLNTKSVRTEINRICIHGQYFLLVMEHFYFRRRNPLLTLHDKQFHTRDIAQQSGRILSANSKHVFNKLLCNGRGTTSIMVNNIVFGCCYNTTKVNSVMMEETFIFSRYKSLPENRIDIFILDRRSVLTEEFSNELIVATVYLRCLTGNGAFDHVHTWGLTEKPKEIDVNSYQIQDKCNHHRYDGYNHFRVPCTSFIKTFIPCPRYR